jgi:hypothetical protein
MTDAKQRRAELQKLLASINARTHRNREKIKRIQEMNQILEQSKHVISEKIWDLTDDGKETKNV